MKNLLICTSLVTLFVTGESLVCQTCGVNIGGRCLWSSKQACNDFEFSCFYGRLAFNMTSLMDLDTEGCLPLSLCNSTEAGSFLLASCTITRTCCSTVSCNGATSVQLPLTAASVAALTAVWRLQAF